MKDSNYGRVSEIKDEKEVMQATLCVLLPFQSCGSRHTAQKEQAQRRPFLSQGLSKVCDHGSAPRGALRPPNVLAPFRLIFTAQKLATKYFSTLFVRVDVANVPFLVEKLEIRILPCVVCFVEGVSKDRCACACVPR